MIIKPYNKSQLQGIRDGLRRELNAVLAANDFSKKKLDKLSSPEYLKKYRPGVKPLRRSPRLSSISSRPCPTPRR